MQTQHLNTSAQIVCILGMHRSGTSVVAQLLSLLGVFLGPDEQLMAANEYNERGYWEHHGIAELNENILLRNGGSWKHPPSPAEGWAHAPALADFRQQARTLLETTFAGQQAWGWKDPRTCLTLSFWRTLVAPSDYVLCVRNPLEVIHSLQRRDKLSMEQAASLWLTYTAAMFQQTSDSRRIVIFYEDLLANPQQQIARLAHFIGRPELLEAPEQMEALLAAVGGDLQHYRATPLEVIDTTSIPFAARALYATLRACPLGEPLAQSSAQLPPILTPLLSTFSAHALAAFKAEQQRAAELATLQAHLGELQEARTAQQAAFTRQLTDLQEAGAQQERALSDRIARLLASHAEIRQALRASKEQAQHHHSTATQAQTELAALQGRIAHLEGALAYAGSLDPRRVGRRYAAAVRQKLSNPIPKGKRRLKAFAKRILRRPVLAPASAPAHSSALPFIAPRVSSRAPWPGPLISVILPHHELDEQARALAYCALQRQTFKALEVVEWDVTTGRAWLHEAPEQAWAAVDAASLSATLQGKYVCVAATSLDTLPATFFELNALALEMEGLEATFNSFSSQAEAQEAFAAGFVPGGAAQRPLTVMLCERVGPDLQYQPMLGVVAQRRPFVAARLLVHSGVDTPPGLRVWSRRLPTDDACTLTQSPYLLARGSQAGWGEASQTIAPADQVFPAPERPAGRPRMLVVMPFIAVGGAEKITLDVLSSLKQHFEPVVVTIDPLDARTGSMVSEYINLTPYVYTLPDFFPRQLFFSLFCYLIEHYNIETLFVANGAGWIYDAAEHLRLRFPHLHMVNQVYDHKVGWIERYDKSLVRTFDRHIAPNQHIVKAYQAHGVPQQRIDLIYHGVDLAAFDASSYAEQQIAALKTRFGLPVEQPVVAFYARMHPQKRPFDFILLAQRFAADEASFFMVGEGMLQDEVDGFLKNNQLAHVHRMGFYKPFIDLLAVADVVVIPSEYEGLPLVLLNAQAMGRPVVATDVGAIREVLDLTGGGEVVDKIGDISAMEHAVRKLLTSPPERRVVRERLRERFDVSQVAEQYRAALMKP